MKYYPVFLSVRDQACLVVGGGEVGTRKAMTLAAAGAWITAISLSFTGKLRDLPGVRYLERPFEDKDLEGMFLVYAATSDPQVNQIIIRQARDRGILCNAGDAPEQGTFILPATVSRGDLILAVSTCGASPALSRQIRRDLDAVYGPEYADFLVLMRSVRARLLASGHDPKGHREKFRQLIAQNIPALIAAGDIPAVDAVMQSVLGPGFVCRDLMCRGGI